ncbi:hypothetical protein, partial [Streptococcus anginosus]|uniref:hypothetical protein n=1 Tax=Streptococcus anginosus TaxID=1328 RepID=UPI002EDB0FEC
EVFSEPLILPRRPLCVKTLIRQGRTQPNMEESVGKTFRAWFKPRKKGMICAEGQSFFRVTGFTLF